MVRKKVYVEPAQELILTQVAKEHGVTEAELIRRAIDALARTPSRPPFDLEASHAVAESIDERAQVPPTAQGRTWTRDDIYQERLGRFSR